MASEHDIPTVTLPLQGWRQVRRRIRQLQAIHEQQNALIESLYQVLDNLPDEGGNG
jgi:hypothetical protein